jgi:MFS family permease
VTSAGAGPDRAARVLLTLAAVAVAFAAADTYVVVMALPEMMTTVGVPVTQLQRAAPIVSGFLLGYVAMLPLVGRIADLRGRVPVLLASLVVFAFGSLVTALSYDLASMVVGRFLQGVGGGGLVPATLALVADLYPPRRRGVPLGVVSAVQELGAVLGPLFGALVLTVAEWQAIFLVNLAVGLVLAAVIRTRFVARGRSSYRPDLLGLLLALVAAGAALLVVLRPSEIARDVTWGEIFVPYVGESRWLTPVGVVAIAASLLFLVRCLLARRPLVDLRGWLGAVVEADLLGALLLGTTLGGVILAFATADPEVQVFADLGPWYLAGSLFAAVAYAVHARRARDPLVPRGALAEVPAWGALVVSLFVGSALIAALIDIPIYARTTIHRESQLMAALVLVRFLVALPVGAVVGGFLTRRFSAGLITGAGMLLSALGFVLMAQWGETSLEHLHTTGTLLLCGFGFGLALAPVNAALLAATADDVHGVAAALVVVARMIGMLVGVSALTAIGLRRFYDARREGLSNVEAALAQEHTVFLGAAVCAAAAAVLALVLFRGARTRDVATAEILRTG